jgi:hypothetical protein
MAHLGRVPHTGDSVELPARDDQPGVLLHVAGMDGRRISRILVVPTTPVGLRPEPESGTASLPTDASGAGSPTPASTG